jgi:hypothetical protein
MYLKTALVEAANAAARAKGTYLRDKFYRLKARRGYKRAAVAIAHKILVAPSITCSPSKFPATTWEIFIWTSLTKPPHTRPGASHRLERLGYSVTLTPQQKAA